MQDKQQMSKRQVLQAARRARFAVKAAEDTLELVQSTLDGIHGMSEDKIQVQPSSSATERGALDHIGAMDRLQETVRYWQEMIRKAQDIVSSVQDPEHQAVLMYYYLCGYTWHQVADAMQQNMRTVQRKHGKALLALE